MNAYSWGKRHIIHCPDCGRPRWMRIIHVDENGQPDQTLGLVLRKVLGLQILILSALLLILTLAAVIGWAIFRVTENGVSP